MHADRTNRITLLLLALLLMAVGLDAGAASLGLWGRGTQHGRLMANPTGRFFGAQGAWLWPALAGAALIVLIVALRWLAALLFSTDRAGDLPIAPHGRPGRTVLSAGALTGAVAGEIESYRGVDAARARLIGDPDRPRLVVTATLEETADLAAQRQRIETEALTHAREALADPGLAVQLDLTVTTRRASRVS
jgi:hypothetical protein